jgi:hypothetical protein
MSKKSKIILFILFVISIITIILIIKKQEKVMNKFEFPSTVVVEDYTKFKVDTVLKVIVNKILNIDTITIKVYNLPEFLKNIDNIELKAFLMPNQFNKNEYFLYLNDKNLEQETTLILCHESVHLKQYEKGDLVFVSQTSDHIFYKGKKIVFKECEYNKRPYEIEAFSEQNKVFRKLKKLLYK